MPRKPARRIPSDEVQGPESYVVLRRPLWGEFEAIQQDLADRATDDKATEAEYSHRTNALRIGEWNWTDEDGKPLPAPLTDWTVLRRLTDEEYGWLVGCINRREEADAAASKSGSE